MKRAFIFLCLSLIAVCVAVASSINLTLDQSGNTGDRVNSVNLTTEGSLDWGLFTGDGGATITTPAQSRIGGVGFVSLTTIGGASNTAETFSNPENRYSWTDGIPAASGNNTGAAHDRFALGPNGAGLRLSVAVAAAGSYRLKFFTTTYDVGLSGTAELGSGATKTVTGTNPDSVLHEFYWTVDFTTDGADTLTLDVLKSSGPNNICSFEAFTLAQTGAPAPNLAVAASSSFSTGLAPTVLSIPFSNTGSSALSISGIVTSGPQAANFTVQSYTASLSPNASGTFQVAFNPASTRGYFNAQFLIDSNDPDSPNTSTTVTVLASAASLGKVLCVGDSITEGRSGLTPVENGYSWRYYFWRRCLDHFVGHQFVGTRTANQGDSVGYPTYGGKSFTNSHEAIWGTTADERELNLDTALNVMAATTSTPDTVILFVGGNGVTQNTTVNTTEIAAITADISSMINMAQGEVAGVIGNPNVTVYVVSILPRFSGTTPDPRNANGFSALNAHLAALPASQTTATSKVSYLDSFSAMNNSSLYYDGVHPNATGEDHLAELFFCALVPDRDYDGLYDAWEKSYFPNLSSTSGGADSDGDGQSDATEYAFGSSPVSAGSRPARPVIDPSTNTLHLTLPAPNSSILADRIRSFEIRSSPDLMDWATILLSGTASGNEIVVPLTFSESRRFYRVNVSIK